MEKNKGNITLIGMPGVGKSTVGVILAKMLGYRFVDTDLVIQEQTGKLLARIIEEQGTDGFLAVENSTIAGIDIRRAVIATGGSAVYGKQAMQRLKETGTVVYLKLPYDILARRLSNIKERGVVLRDGQTLADIYAERSVLYEKYADIVVEEAGLDVEQTIEQTMEKLLCMEETKRQEPL